MNIAIYSRKSKFTGKGESSQNQIELCKEYIDKHFTIDEMRIYEDEGFSGGNINRPQFRQMLQDAKKQKFNMLICYRLDRISRNITDFSNLIETLQESNIAFVSIREQFDTSTPMGRAMMYITSVFAQLERETIAERIRDNMLQLAKAGRWLGGITPTGFRSEAFIYLDANMNKRKAYKLSSIPEEIELVKTIYTKYLELGSLSQVESFLLETGIKSKNGKYFDKSALKNILTNPVYASADRLLYEYFKKYEANIANHCEEFDGRHGVLVYNKNIEKKGKRSQLREKSEWIVAIAKHKGVIPSEHWISVQSKIEANKKKAPRSGTSKVALLTPLLVCAKCGSKLRVIYKMTNGEIRNHYYKCTLKERSKGSLCKMKNLNGPEAESQVVNHLKYISLRDNEFYQEIEKETDQLKKASKDYELQSTKLKQELKETEKQIENLTKQLALHQDSTAVKYIIRQIEDLDKKVQGIKLQAAQNSKHNELSHMQQINITLMKDLIQDFALSADALGFEDKKLLLREVIRNIVWDGESLQINIF